MTRGLYIAASGMLNEMSRQNIIANNLANVNTTGYKRDIPMSKAFPSMLLHRIHDPQRIFKEFIIDPRPIVGRMGTGVNPDNTAHDFVSHPAYQTTENTFDLALYGDGFFAVQTPTGTRYTRNGNFVMDEDRRLVTIDGHPVLGENGPIQIKGTDVNIDQDGYVSVNGEFVDKIQVVDFPKPYQLTKLGNSMFVPVDRNIIPQPATTVRVQSRVLELSNVNIVTEMVDLITITRAYEANQRAVLAQNDTIGRAINDVGRPSA